MLSTFFTFWSFLIRKIKLLWIFYKNSIIPFSIISIICIRLFWLFGFSVFFEIFWCKVITYLVIIYFIDENKKNEYFFYKNLGIEIRKLWAITIALDFTLFLFSLILTYKLK